MGTAHRRRRHRPGHRRARPRQRGWRSLHRARRRVADGAAVGACGHMGARPRRLPGNPPSRYGGPRHQGVLDGDIRGDPGTRPRQGDRDRHLRAAGSGAFELAVGSARGAGRKQRNRLAGYAENRRDRAGARRAGCRCRARGHRRCRTARHPRGPSAVEQQRTRARRQIGARHQGTGRDHGEPARHRRRHARGILRIWCGASI